MSQAGEQNAGHPQTPAKPQAAARKLNIDLLKIIHASRQTYGLRTNDYARYHAHAVRRVNTLHRATKTLNKPFSKSSGGKAKPSKTSSGPAGNKSSNKKTTATYTSTTTLITAEAVLRDERLLELLVWEVERAWSEGMKQREEIAALERGSSSHALASRRHRAVKRFQRACQYAELLSNIAREIYKMPQALLTASAAFQIQIYLQYMRGTLAFVKASSPGATAVQANMNALSNSTLQPLSHAYVLLEVYGQSCHQATEEAIAFELLDELEPMIRFCAYKAGTSQNETPAEIAKDAGRNALEELEDDYHFPGLLAQLAKDTKLNRRKSKQEPETVQHLSWRDIDVPIRSAELADTFGRVNKAIQDIRSRRSRTDSFQRKDKSETSMLNRFHSSINTFDRALSILIDAENKARKLVDDNTTALARAHSSRFEIAARPLTLVHSYILFHLLATRLQRDNLLIGQTLSRLAKREAKVTIEDTTFGPTSMRVKRRRMKLYPTIIKLLDGMVQSLERMRLLPVVEDDSTDLAEQVDASLACVKARRCLYLGETYSMVDRFPEALTLVQRGGLYYRQAQTLLQSVDVEDHKDVKDSSTSVILENLQSELPSVQAALEKAEVRASKDWYFHRLGPSEDLQAAASVETAVESLTLTAPTLKDKKRKRAKPGPTFYDVAFSYIAPVAIVDTNVPNKSATTLDPASVQKDVVPSDAADTTLMNAEAPQSDPPASSTSGRGLWGLFGRRR